MKSQVIYAKILLLFYVLKQISNNIDHFELNRIYYVKLKIFNAAVGFFSRQDRLGKETE